jgi:hypothetical protein
MYISERTWILYFRLLNKYRDIDENHLQAKVTRIVFLGEQRL